MFTPFNSYVYAPVSALLIIIYSLFCPDNLCSNGIKESIFENYTFHVFTMRPYRIFVIILPLHNVTHCYFSMLIAFVFGHSGNQFFLMFWVCFSRLNKFSAVF